MATKRKLRRTVGDIVSIPLEGGSRIGFGIVLDEPLVAFFDFWCGKGDEPSVDEIVRKPIAFSIWVANKPITDGSWSVLGRSVVPPSLIERPWFYKCDRLSGRITVGRTGSEELTPEPGQVERLERASVWSECHVIERLEDHFRGRPNRWVKSMQVR